MSAPGLRWPSSSHALFDTAHGRVLVVKLGLIAGLFLLAAINRWSLTAPVLAGDGPATTRLVRTIATETAIVLLSFRSRRPGVSRRRRAPWPPPRLSLRRCISTPTRRWPSFR
ncbi:MAG: CopD family protein [Ensifer alkalisoli]|nr:CopD family protein [Sinorhizobium alkalisoli]